MDGQLDHSRGRNSNNVTSSNLQNGIAQARTITATTTVTITQDEASTTDTPILRLTLRPQSHVSWDEGVINNEGLGRKSSKRCCIFHKQRAFGESSTESSEDNDDGSTSSSSSGGGGSGKAQRPLVNKKKKGKVGKPKVPDYQRFHA